MQSLEISKATIILHCPLWHFSTELILQNNFKILIIVYVTNWWSNLSKKRGFFPPVILCVLAALFYRLRHTFACSFKTGKEKKLPLLTTFPNDAFKCCLKDFRNHLNKWQDSSQHMKSNLEKERSYSIQQTVLNWLPFATFKSVRYKYRLNLISDNWYFN